MALPPVAVIDAVPTYRRGLVAALTEADFAAEAPGDLSDWARRHDRRVLVVAARSAAEWELLEDFGSGCPRTVAVAILPTREVGAYEEAFRRGACSAAPEDAPVERLVQVVEAAIDDHVLLPADIVRTLAARDAQVDRPSWLTEEEQRWLHCLAEGLPVATLGRRVGFSERTMHRLLHSLYARLEVRNRSQAIAEAGRRGLLDDLP